MFCRFGLLLESLPVAATVWLKEVWTRTGHWVDKARESIDIAGLQLGNLPELQDQPGQFIVLRELFQHLNRSRKLAGFFQLLRGRKIQFLEKYFPKLFWRADVEICPCQFKDFLT